MLERNSIVRTQSGGFLLESSTDNQTGVTRYPTGNVITRNTMAANLFGGALLEANANQVTHNSVTDAGKSSDPTDPIAGLGLVIDGASGNLLARNAITHGRGVGIQIDVAHNRTVKGNLAAANTADGIHVLSATTTLTATSPCATATSGSRPCLR